MRNIIRITEKKRKDASYKHFYGRRFLLLGRAELSICKIAMKRICGIMVLIMKNVSRIQMGGEKS